MLETREIPRQECTIHRLKALSHRFDACGMYYLKVVHALQNWQVVIPELNRSIKHQPGLFRVLAQLDSLYYMLSKFAFLLVKYLLLLLSELSVVLVII
jgi:hypothetical protein